jgi:hypothetical protein
MIRPCVCALLTLSSLGATVALAQDKTSAQHVVPLDNVVLGSAVPITPPLEKLEAIDANSLELRLVQGGWQLWAGQTILKDFGRKEKDARAVLNLIRALHLDVRGRLGAPHAVAEYWLAGGRPPQSAPSGARTVGFDADSLSVQQINDQWMLRDQSRALLSFANNEAEARRALAVFKHHHFDRVGYVGEPVPTFMYFLATSGSMQSADAGTSIDPTRMAERGTRGLQNPDHPRSLREIDPRKGSQLLPPGRQLIQVTSLPGQANLPDRLPFNFQKAKLHQIGDHWELVAQDLTLARFGSDAKTAREAMAMLRHYHFTEMCLIGGDTPCFQFLLANGRMPRDVRFGISNIAFLPERVQVRQKAGEFTVEHEGVCLCNCGENESAAQALLTFIRQNNPDHLCWIGASPGQGMTFFARTSLAPFNSRNDGPVNPR